VFVQGRRGEGEASKEDRSFALQTVPLKDTTSGAMERGEKASGRININCIKTRSPTSSNTIEKEGEGSPDHESLEGKKGEIGEKTERIAQAKENRRETLDRNFSSIIKMSKLNEDKEHAQM